MKIDIKIQREEGHCESCGCWDSATYRVYFDDMFQFEKYSDNHLSGWVGEQEVLEAILKKLGHEVSFDG